LDERGKERMVELIDKTDIALSIVVPVYNGADSVPELVNKLSALSVDGGLEIILVNDCSPDNSLEVCNQLLNEVVVPLKVVNLSRNFGEHNAVMAGYAEAKGEFIINMDDDLQNPPEEVINLWRYTKENQFDVVYTRYESKEHKAWRNIGSRFTNWCANYLLDKPEGLYLSSFRCVSAFVAKQVVGHTGPFPYIDGLIMQITQNIGSLTVQHVERKRRDSNYTVARLIRLFLSMFLNFSVIPLRAATAFGSVIALIGILAVLAVIVEAIFGNTPQGWASLMAVVMLLSGVQLIMLGVIGEYLGRMFLTANQRPQYIVKNVKSNDITKNK